MMISTLILALAAAASFNLLLQFGLGFRPLVLYRSTTLLSAVRGSLIIIITGPIVYLLFTYLISPAGLGFASILLLYPLTVLFCLLADRYFFPLFAIKVPKTDQLAMTAYDGMALANAYFIIRMTSDLLQAMVFSIGSGLGILISIIILNAVRDRCETENVPISLRGLPLMLIATGLLSLVVTYLAVLGLSALGAGQ